MKSPRIAALVADGFQEEECLVPRFALEVLGGRVDIVSSKKSPIEIYSYFEKVGTYDVDFPIDEISAEDYDGVLIPGGAMSPALLSQDERVKSLVRAIAHDHKLVACICRGVLLAANAGVVRGRCVTGFVTDGSLSSQQDKELAVEPAVVANGGIWENKEVVVDRNFISSRHPQDMRMFTRALVTYLWQGTKESPFELQGAH